MTQESPHSLFEYKDGNLSGKVRKAPHVKIGARVGSPEVNGYETVYVDWLACGGGGSSTSFTDYDGYSHVIGTICAQEGTVSISSGNGAWSNTYTTC
jgi:hypothetical protein